MDDRLNTTAETGTRELTEEELEVLSGGADQGAPFGCPRCGPGFHVIWYSGSKKNAYKCGKCGCLFRQDYKNSPTYEVNDCD